MSNERQYTHGEAYCLMKYAPSIRDQTARGTDQRTAAKVMYDEANAVTIWNSRDGVSPFMCMIHGIECQHIDWHQDVRVVDHVPQVGDYIFTDMSYEDWEQMERQNIDRWWDGTEEGDYPLKERYATKEEALAAFMKEFRPGQPQLVKVDERLHAHFEERARILKQGPIGRMFQKIMG